MLFFERKTERKIIGGLLLLHSLCVDCKNLPALRLTGGFGKRKAENSAFLYQNGVKKKVIFFFKIILKINPNSLEWSGAANRRG